jgi:4-hydroxybenzoate polyprenyltransferase
MIAYSLKLKMIVLLDAVVLAAGFALRVVVGAVAVDIRPSAQLLEFCVLLFFSLAPVKRYAELTLLHARDGPGAHARAYRVDDQGLLLALGSGGGNLRSTPFNKVIDIHASPARVFEVLRDVEHWPD